MAPTAPGIVAGSTGADLTAQLAEEWEELASLGAELDDDDWAKPTPCPEWPVSAQYAHIVGTESALLGRPSPPALTHRPRHVLNHIGAFNELWISNLRPLSRKELLAEFDQVTS